MTPGDQPVEFTCNICGRRNSRPPAGLGRETASCDGCQSTVRARSIIYMLSMELFGVPVALRDFPRVKAIRGIGLSDSCYPDFLARRLGYTNTFLHKEPTFDITRLEERHTGAYDFLISSEVFEHVAPPADRAFANAFQALKPNGVLLLTVPYTLGEKTAEHFPDLYQYGLAQVGGSMVLVNRTRGGELQVFDNLCFHGGAGSTLEARVYTEAGLRSLLNGAGFTSVRIYSEDYLPFGIVHHEPWSLPMAARKQPFALSLEAVCELVTQSAAQRVRARRWRGDYLRIQKEFREYHAASVKEAEDARRDLQACADWTAQLDRQVKDRTEWGLKLDAEIASHTEEIKRLQKENQEMSEWAAGANAEAERLRAHIEALNRRKWSRIGRKLGLL